MKRSSEDVPKRKRLSRRFKPAHFPNVDGKSPFEIDFTLYARTNSPDIIITNGSIEFESHKLILGICSPVIEDIIQSDSMAKEVKLKDVPDNVLELFYNLMYDTPGQRKERRFSEQPLVSFQCLKDCLQFLAKYDCKIMHQWLISDVVKSGYMIGDGEKFEEVYDHAMAMNVKDFAKIIEEHEIRYRNNENMKLDSFSPDMVLKMIRANKFNRDFQFFEKALNYAILNPNEEVKEVLEVLENVRWGEEQYGDDYEDRSFERKKVAVYSKLLFNSSEKPSEPEATADSNRFPKLTGSDDAFIVVHNDIETDENTEDHKPDGRPICRYGRACYRDNAAHFEQQAHPWLRN